MPVDAPDSVSCTQLADGRMDGAAASEMRGGSWAARLRRLSDDLLACAYTSNYHQSQGYNARKVYNYLTICTVGPGEGRTASAAAAAERLSLTADELIDDRPGELIAP